MAGLGNLPQLPFDPAGDLAPEAAVYSHQENGFRYDFIVNPKAIHHQRLYVFFSGDAQRRKYSIPVFQRWKWADQFPGHVMYISDPTLYLHESLSLAWYLGTDDQDAMPGIARLISSVAAMLNVPQSRIFSYGSSGGGFTALRLGLFMPEIGMVAVNPQIHLPSYWTGAFRRVLQHTYAGKTVDQAMQMMPERFSLLLHIETLRARRIVYVQNALDEHHVAMHLGPFAEMLDLKEANGFRQGDARVLFFSHEGGHTVGEPIEMVQQVCRITESYAP